MFQSKDLSDEQIASLRNWAAEGDQLADLQRKLKDEFSLNVTYMDMRFVVLDLGLEILTEEEPEPEEEPEVEAAESALAAGEVPDAGSALGSVSVSVDQIATPGAMVSGRVTFSDGESGRWMIDQMGRPSLDPETAGYQPTHEDLVSFQNELRKSLEGEPGLGL